MKASFWVTFAIVCVAVAGFSCGAALPSGVGRAGSPAEGSAPFGSAAAEGDRTLKGGTAPSEAESESASQPWGTRSPGANSGEVGATDPNTLRLVREMVARVAKARGLPVKRAVKSRELARPEMISRIRAQVEKDQPMEVVARQGEFLAALELVPPEYDFIAGTFRLIEGQIAGFYLPDDETMFLVDDLSEREAEETLAHELVHALQDQSYSLGKLLKHTPGEGDRLSAVHALAEGDAMSAMFDVTTGSAFNISESALRRLLAISMALTTTGAGTPRVLQAALAAPYADGFAFVQALRRRGGWQAVDEAWRALPTTTEQLLHLDKFDAREPALPVPTIPLSALGEGWESVVDEPLGEQGLRMSLEGWTNLSAAARGAAGWGGDRQVVARKAGASGSGSESFAVAWALRFDTVRDAEEMLAIVKKRFGATCRVRKEQGPIVWRSSGSAVVVVAGPYERHGQTLVGTGSCTTAEAWLGAVLKGMP